MRVFIAGLLGGLVIFIWGAVSHMALPLGEMGMAETRNEDAVIAVLKENMPSTGVYMVPGLSNAQMSDEAAVNAYQAKATSQPNAFVVYQAQGRDGTQMSQNLLREYLSNTLAALFAAIMLALGPFSFGKRVVLSVGLGLFSWLTVSAPYWNWYRFPQDFSLANLAELAIGWLLAGIVMAWWLGRSGR
ncbi:MAG: hypothetical protein KAZ45_01945 [Arenimonas sp.]|nr:hypothetical protein [Arenimonas sp.]